MVSVVDDDVDGGIDSIDGIDSHSVDCGVVAS